MRTTLTYRAVTATLALSAAFGGIAAARADAGSDYFVANGSPTTDDSAKVTGTDAVAAGPRANAAADASTAVGAGAQALQQGASAIGDGATASGVRAVALGNAAVAGNTDATALGSNATASAAGTVALGANASATSNGAVAIGQNALATSSKSGSIAIGHNAVASTNTTPGNIAIGEAASALGGGGTIAMGNSASTTSYNSIAIGQSATAAGSLAVAIGTHALVSSQGGVAVGYYATAKATADTAIGDQAYAESSAPTRAATSVGTKATSGESAVAVGGHTYATALQSTAVGAAAHADAQSSAAFGYGAQVVSSATNAVALGQGSVADRANTVSVGTAGAERQITNVAAGTADTDAVNVSQLKQAGLVGSDGSTLDALVYDAGSNRAMVTLGGIGAASAVTLTNVAAGRIAADSTDAVNGSQLFQLTSRVDALSGNGVEPPRDNVGDGGGSGGSGSSALDGGGQRVTNVAAGIADTDAVNVGQMNSAVDNGVQQANAYTNQQISGLRADMDGYRKDASAGSASAIAMANLPQAVLPGERVVSIAGGTFGGQSAMAIGLSTATQKWMVKGSVTTNTRSSVGAGVGVGYRW